MHGLSRLRARTRIVVLVVAIVLLVTAHVVALRYVSAHAVLPATIVSAVVVAITIKVVVLKHGRRSRPG